MDFRDRREKIFPEITDLLRFLLAFVQHDHTSIRYGGDKSLSVTSQLAPGLIVCIFEGFGVLFGLSLYMLDMLENY